MKLQSKQGSGIGNIDPEMVKYIVTEENKWFSSIFRVAWDTRKISDQWK